VVQFTLVLFGGAHYVNGEQFFALLAVVAVEENLDQVVHGCLLRDVETFVLGLKLKFRRQHFMAPEL